MIKCNLLLVPVFILCYSSIFAQKNYYVKHFTSENGLPQNSIKNIAADSEGFIWLATEEGLVRFDGQRFYVLDQGNLPIKSSRVAYIEPSIRNEVIPNQPIHSNKQRSVFYAWFETHETIRIEAGKATPCKGNFIGTDTKEKGITKDTRNLYFVSDLPDRRWLQVRGQKFLINCGTMTASFYLCDSVSVSYYHKWQKKYKIPYKVPKMWNYFSLSNRLYYFHEQMYFTKIDNKIATTFSLEGDILNDPAYRMSAPGIKLYWNNNGGQAFLLLNKNLYRLAEKKNGDLTTQLLIADFDLNAEGIETIYFDKANGKTYLGSRTNGLFILTNHQFQSLTVKGDNIANALYAQLPYQNKQIVTPTGVILSRDSITNKVIEKRLEVLHKNNPTDKQAIIRDKNGIIWTKTYNLLLRLDEKQQKITGQWKLISEISSMIQAQDGNVWFSTLDQGLYSINPDHANSQPVRFKQDSLRFITYLESYSPKELLVGTQTGLYKVDLTKKKYRLIGQTKGLHIKSLHKFNQNQVWITAKGKGLLLMDGDEFITPFPLDKNRYLASPHCAVNDELGYLWIPTNKGLFQMAIPDLLQYSKLFKSFAQKKKSASSDSQIPRQLFYKYHTTEEGFITNEFNGGCQPCGLRLKNGTISLPSLNGFVWFDPRKIDRYMPNGGLVLDKTELNGDILNIHGDTIPLTVNPKNIKLYFSTANRGNDYNLQLSYTLLEPGEKVREANWTPIETNDFTVRYSSLKSGTYHLLVRKTNGFGIHNYTIKKLWIIVPPKWYETI